MSVAVGQGRFGLTLRLVTVVSVLLAGPVALIWGSGTSSGADVTSEPSPRPGAHAERRAVGLEADPPPHCMRRFLDPFDAISAFQPPVPAPSLASSAAPAGPAPAGPLATSQWDAQLDRAQKHVRQSLGDGVDIDVLIATVPDPIDSGLAYYFDAALPAFQRAIERRLDGTNQALNRDRSWNPWDDRYVPASDRDASAECRRTAPGVILFRSATSPPGLTALLLVGETPTSGVHLTAMINALRASKILTAGHRRAADAESSLKIIGPTFSGSAFSMRLALETWDREFAQPGAEPERRPGSGASVRIITGSANGSDVPRILKTPLSNERPKVSFQATTVPETDLECAFFRFVERLGDTKTKSHQQRVLAGVALLEESGTEFGSTKASNDPGAEASDQPACEYEAEVHIGFPFHVSALRDAYEEIDHRTGARAELDATIARHTELDVSLREPKRPLDVEADPAQKTTFSRDIALAHVLSEISTEGVRYVGIRATDVGDAIFVARKIRDVAPDVRLAFFDADALMFHSEFRHDLLGSFVVTPYPFLGSGDFSPKIAASVDPLRAAAHVHIPFENASAEGLFNAVVAMRGSPTDLWEYNFPEPLPIWIATIARDGLVPVDVKPWCDREETIVRPAGRDVPTSCVSTRSAAAPAVTRLDLGLPIDDDVSLPRLWHIVFACLLLAWIADRQARKRCLAGFAKDVIQTPLDATHDQELDLALGRTKWLFYAVIRAFLFVMVTLYMSAVYVTAYHTYPELLLGYVIGVAAPVAATATIVDFLLSFARFVRDFARLHRVFRYLKERRDAEATAEAPVPASQPKPPASGPASTPQSAPPSDLLPSTYPPPPPSTWLGRCRATLWDPIPGALGFGDPYDQKTTVLASYGQLRALVVLAALIAAAASGGLVRHVSGAWLGGNVAQLRFFVLRSLPLINGVSACTPLLLSTACVYVWCVGRMARLRQVHAVSRLSTRDGVTDGVSTPIRAILHPRHSETAPGEPDDIGNRMAKGLTFVERDLMNALLRPSTGSWYFCALIGVAFLPVVLFALIKRPTTLEETPVRWLLTGSLALCAVLLSATLIQFYQYWVSLELLLKRVMEHPLGRAFGGVGSFVREPIHDQVARSPNDALRLVACAQQFEELVRLHQSMDVAYVVQRLPDLLPTGLGEVNLHERAREVSEARSKALYRTARREREKAASAEAEVGRAVIAAARETTFILEAAWNGQLAGARGASPEGWSEEPAPDALTPVRVRFSGHEIAWLRKAQSFVSTVVAVLVNRYVRQFRIFLYALNVGAVLLLLAFASYPFEPHRLLLTCIWGLMTAIVVAGLSVFVQLDRNTLLSLISGTVPDRVTLNGALARRIMTWVVLPLLFVAAAQYPEVANALFRWLAPFAKALR